MHPHDLRHRFGYRIEDTAPVRTVVFGLRSEPDGPAMRTAPQRQFRGETAHLQFNFRVSRFWERPVHIFLQGRVRILPLAALRDLEPEALPALIRRMVQRIDAESPDEARTLWTSDYTLTDPRYPREFTAQLDKEEFADVTAGEKHIADLVMRVKFRGQDAFFLIHVEP